MSAAGRVLLLTEDPYLGFLLERHPEGLEVTPADLAVPTATVLATAVDVVVIDHDDPRRVELLRSRSRPALVTVTPGGVETPLDGESTLRRPLSAVTVQHAIDSAMNTRRRSGDVYGADASSEPFAVMSSTVPIALLTSALLGLGVTATAASSTAQLAAALVFTAYAALRVRRTQKPFVYLDIVVAALALAVGGGILGPYLVFAVVAIVGVGLRSGLRAGALLGLAPAIAAIVGGLLAAAPAAVVWRAAPAVLVMPLAGAAAGIGMRSAGEREEDHRYVSLQRVNLLLGELRDLARSAPGGLELGEVLRATVEEVRNACRADSAVLAISQEGVLVPAAAAGPLCVPERPLCSEISRELLSLDVPRVLTGAHIDQELRAWVEDEDAGPTCSSIVVVPLRDRGRRTGVVILPWRGGEVPLEPVRAAARLAGVAVENALLFARVREDSMDEERRRLAGELHDSTVQVLTHVRMELELLGRSRQVEQSEVVRLARVVQRAQLDLRQVINGLRGAVAEDGLTGALRSYVGDLRSVAGPKLSLRIEGRSVHTAETEREIFRIAQEAISNALRHGRPGHVDVVLRTGLEGTVLRVQDDGSGLPAPEMRRDGFGLEQMAGRAARIGGHLGIGPVPGGSRQGVRVLLTVPVASSSPGIRVAEPKVLL